MALRLQGLSRAAGAVGAASPKVLGAVTPKTPKTPAFSPLARSVARSPLSSAAVTFGDLKAATPKALGKGVHSFLSQTRASTLAQQELAKAARSHAEVAQQYFLARQSRGRPAETLSSAAPTLLSGWGLRTNEADASRAEPLPVLLGSSQLPAPHTSAMARTVKFEFDPLQAARDARERHLARQQQRDGRYNLSVP